MLFRKTSRCGESRDGAGKISVRNIFRAKKSYEFSIKRVYVVRQFIMYRSVGAVCSPLPPIINFSICEWTAKYYSAHGREERKRDVEKKKGESFSSPSLSTRKRESPESTGRTNISGPPSPLSLILQPVWASKKLRWGETEEEGRRIKK